tara:strand:+ start:708 stop:923 length:216 start_codon:yes stop_codon:yes gene_type:complete
LKNLNVIKYSLTILAIFFISQTAANAYFGPAIGFGLLAIMILFILSLIIAIIAIFYSPIKKIILKLKNWKK